MEFERDSSIRQREMSHLNTVKHGHERPVENGYYTIDFTPPEGRMLILFFKELRCSDARLHLQSAGELVLMLNAADKLVAGLKAAGY
jgi:hypothetical protein